MDLSPTEKIEPVKQSQEKPDLDKFFLDIGLASPLDYCFLNFAQSKSRMNIQSSDAPLQFLFHLSSKDDLESKKPFPKSIFLEKIVGEENKNVLYTFIPSETWGNKSNKSFGEFHLYFMDHMKPSTPYSVEEIYKILDERRNKDEKYFVTSGGRDTSSDQKIHVIFVTSEAILAFCVDRYEADESDEFFSSKWISLSDKNTIRIVNEVDVFDFPDHYLVMTEDEAKISSITTMDETTNECKDCKI